MSPVTLGRFTNRENIFLDLLALNERSDEQYTQILGSNSSINRIGYCPCTINIFNLENLLYTD